jgi:predicted DNA binding protein
MRELVFTIEFEPGTDPVMDVFAEHPEARARMIACAVSPENSWRLDRITGPEAALSRLDDVFLDPTRCNECLDGRPTCGATREYEVLERDATSRIVYTYLVEPGYCHSIPPLATEHLGFGVLYDARRRGPEYEWRLLVPDDAGVGTLHDALDGGLKDGLSLDVRRLSRPTHWYDRFVTTDDLAHEQREALEAAVDGGYYETPRGVTLDALAGRLDLPRSTLRYRLRRAEAWLVERFVNATGRTVS